MPRGGVWEGDACGRAGRVPSARVCSPARFLDKDTGPARADTGPALADTGPARAGRLCGGPPHVELSLRPGGARGRIRGAASARGTLGHLSRSAHPDVCMCARYGRRSTSCVKHVHTYVKHIHTCTCVYVHEVRPPHVPARVPRAPRGVGAPVAGPAAPAAGPALNRGRLHPLGQWAPRPRGAGRRPRGASCTEPRASQAKSVVRHSASRRLAAGCKASGQAPPRIGPG